MCLTEKKEYETKVGNLFQQFFFTSMFVTQTCFLPSFVIETLHFSNSIFIASLFIFGCIFSVKQLLKDVNIWPYSSPGNYTTYEHCIRGERTEL